MVSDTIRQSILLLGRTFRRLIGEGMYQRLLRMNGAQWFLRTGGFTQLPSRRLSNFDISRLHYREVEEALNRHLMGLRLQH